MARGLHWPGSNFKLRHYRLTGSSMPADPHPWRPLERAQHIRNSRAAFGHRVEPPMRASKRKRMQNPRNEIAHVREAPWLTLLAKTALIL